MNNYQHSAQQIVYLTVKLTMIGNCSPAEIIENLDYQIDHPAIVQSEILGLESL
jgi:hypothetical protein